MARTRTLEIKITGDSRGAQRAFGQLEGKAGGFSSKIGAFAKKAAIGLGAAGVGAVVLGKKVLDLGGQLESWRKKTSTVFEGSADDVRRWADNNNELFGVGEEQLAGLAANFGDLLKPMGFTADQAAKMSKDVVGLSGALSEWSGGSRSAAEVSEILAKAMLGEREQLKELGISITEDEVKRRLWTKGQHKLTGAALQQAKALATQELIFEKSTDAQKAFAEGGNKALRAQNRLKAGIEDLKAKAIDKLLPVAISLGDWLGRNLPVLIEKGRAAFQAMQPTIQAVVSFIKTNWPQVQAVIQQVMVTVRSVIQGVLSVVQTLWRNFGDNILSFVNRVWPAIKLRIEGALNIIRGIIQTVTALIRGDWSAVWDGIKRILLGVWQSIQGLVRQSIETVRLILGAALEVIGSIVKRAWEGIKSSFSRAVGDVVGFVRGLPGKIGAFVGDMASKGLALGEAFLDGLKRGITRVGGLAGDVAGAIVRAVKRAWNVVAGRINDFIPNSIGWGPFSLDIPNNPIPTLAKGGITTGPTLAFIGDNPGGREAIVPLPAQGGLGTTINVYVEGSVVSERDLIASINRSLRKGIR